MKRKFEALKNSERSQNNLKGILDLLPYMVVVYKQKTMQVQFINEHYRKIVMKA